MENKTKYPTVVPYLILKKAQNFIDFCEIVFSADLLLKKMREDVPGSIMHGELQIGDSILMFADETEEFRMQVASLFITVEDADEAFQKALDHGAIIVSDLSDQTYGRGGGIKDPQGNTWWITAPIK